MLFVRFRTICWRYFLVPGLTLRQYRRHLIRSRVVRGAVRDQPPPFGVAAVSVVGAIRDAAVRIYQTTPDLDKPGC
jgi:hypothetical protein